MFYDREFETLGSIKNDKQLLRKTRVSHKNVHLEPDAIFMLKVENRKKLFWLEYENKDFTKKSIEKALKHVNFLNQKAVSRKYGHSRGYKVLFVYENDSTLHSVMKHIEENVSNISEWFLFKSAKEVITSGKFMRGKYIEEERKDFFEDWSTAEGNRVSLYKLNG